MEIEKKSDTSAVFEQYMKLEHVTKNFNNRRMGRLYTDEGGEYRNVDVGNQTQTTPKTPQHNPFSERINRTLAEPVRVILEEAELSAKYWEYVTEYVLYIKNRVPHSSFDCSSYQTLTS